ncbi:MAG TPA: histidine kinase [Cyclobacteriaceae bacterium]|nr:histidine kinase [Cyclobacteriaceae bacterium]
MYTAFWVLVSGTHYAFMNRALAVSPGFALTDSLIYNIIYYPLGIAVWYVVKFNKIETGRIIQLILVHLLSAAILSLFWIFLSFQISIVFNQSDGFAIFQRSIFPSRFIIGLFYYLVITLVYYVLIYYHNFREKIEKEAAVNSLLKEAELNALKLQINPHFIFNCLNSINSLIMLKPDLAQEMIVKLSDFLRSTLSGNARHTISLDDEIKFSKLYLEIEKIRFGDKFNFIITMDERLKKIQVPHMLFQPLLENSIKHGVQQSILPVEIVMEIFGGDNALDITIKNKKEGEASTYGEKIGLKNIRERLFLMYNRSDLIKTSDNGDEFVVRITLPVRFSEKNG